MEILLGSFVIFILFILIFMRKLAQQINANHDVGKSEEVSDMACLKTRG